MNETEDQVPVTLMLPEVRGSEATAVHLISCSNDSLCSLRVAVL